MGEPRSISPEHIHAKARVFSEGAVIDGEDTPPFSQGLGYLAKARGRNNLCTIPPIEGPAETADGIVTFVARSIADFRISEEPDLRSEAGAVQ